MREVGCGPPPEREGGKRLLWEAKGHTGYTRKSNLLKSAPFPREKKKTQNKTNDKRNTAIAIVLRLFLNIVLEITLAKCKRILIVPLIHGAGYPNNFTNAITGESFWFITNM